MKHIKHVMKRAMEIAETLEGVDYETLKLAIIFHDIDYSSYDTHVDDSVNVAETFLSNNNYSPDMIKKVKEIMLDHSTPHRKERGDAKSLEGKIIYDADKSISMSDENFRNKYFSKLYLDETKKIVGL